MGPASTCSLTNNNDYNIASSISISSGNAIMPAARYIFGAGNYYMTIDPEHYYPSACLFCGLPNGSKRVVLDDATTTTTTAAAAAAASIVSTSQDIIVATAAPTMQIYSSAGTNEKPHELEEIIVQLNRHRGTLKNLASIMSNQWHALFQRWRRYLIQKRLHLPVVTQGRKRFLIPSSFY